MDIVKKVINPVTGNQKITVRTVNLCNSKLKLHSQVIEGVEVIHTVEKQEY